MTEQNGTLTLGGGSGWVIPSYIVSGLDGVSRRARADGAQVWPVLNDTAYGIVSSTAAGADIALVFVNSYAAEGHDRDSLHLDRNGDILIKTTAAVNNNTVVIIQYVSPLPSLVFFLYRN
jgi:beta-glucosidase